MDLNSGHGDFLTWFKRTQENLEVTNIARQFNLILNVNVVNPPNPDRGQEIRRQIFRTITSNPVLQFENVQYAHQWVTCTYDTSAYYTTRTIFTNDVVAPVIKEWLAAIRNNIAHAGETWKLSFLMTKPLVMGFGELGQPAGQRVFV